MDYTRYTVEDFICDESFQRYCLNPDQNNAGFWNSWRANNPRKRVVVDEAIDFLQRLRSAKATFSKDWYPERKQRIRLRLQDEIRGISGRLTIL